MGDMGNDLPPLDHNPGRSGQESALSGEETLDLFSRLLDSKLDKKFSEFKRGLEQKDLAKEIENLSEGRQQLSVQRYQTKVRIQFEFVRFY